MIQSVFGGSLRERVQRHHALLEELRTAYISERRKRPDEELVSHRVSCALLNVANAIENAQILLSQLMCAIEAEETEQDAAELHPAETGDYDEARMEDR